MDSIVAHSITKIFKKKGKRKYLFGKKIKEDEVVYAVDNVSLKIKKGELFGLLGPNGAGKTTLVKVLATLLLPDSGTAEINGIDVLKDPISCRKILGVTTGGERTLYWKLSARDNLKYFASLYGMSSKEARERIDYLMKIMGLEDRQHERIEKYSTGMRQKVSISRAILHDPEILLLDEPTLGLDPSFSRFLRNFIKEDLNQKLSKTILLTTHYMDEADQLCERIAFMNEGKIIAVDTPKNLKKKIPHEEILELKCMGLPNTLEIEKLGVKVYSKTDSGITELRVQADDVEEKMSDVIDMVRKNSKILNVNVTKPTLEDVFIYMTGVRLEGGK